MAARWCRFREGYLWAALLLAVAAQHICTASLQPELAFSSSEVDDLEREESELMETPVSERLKIAKQLMHAVDALDQKVTAAQLFDKVKRLHHKMHLIHAKKMGLAVHNAHKSHGELHEWATGEDAPDGIDEMKVKLDDLRNQIKVFIFPKDKFPKVSLKQNLKQELPKLVHVAKLAMKPKKLHLSTYAGPKSHEDRLDKRLDSLSQEVAKNSDIIKSVLGGIEGLKNFQGGSKATRSARLTGLSVVETAKQPSIFELKNKLKGLNEQADKMVRHYVMGTKTGGVKKTMLLQIPPHHEHLVSITKFAPKWFPHVKPHKPHTSPPTLRKMAHVPSVANWIKRHEQHESAQMRHTIKKLAKPSRRNRAIERALKDFSKDTKKSHGKKFFWKWRNAKTVENYAQSTGKNRIIERALKDFSKDTKKSSGKKFFWKWKGQVQKYADPTARRTAIDHALRGFTKDTKLSHGKKFFWKWKKLAKASERAG